MLKKAANYLAVSISDDILKIAEVKTGAQPKINNLASAPIKGAGSAELARIIQTTLKGFNPKSSEVVCVVSPSQTSTKNIEVPSIDEDEIQSIVNLQAGRHTPFSRDEIQIGYVNLGSHKPNFTKVLLVIANRTALKSNIKACEQAGLKVKKVLFAPEGIAQFYGQYAALNTDAKPVGIIDIDSSSTNFIVVAGGRPIASRSIPVGAEQLRGGAAAQANLTDELKKTLESYVNDDAGAQPGRFIITSGDEAALSLQGALKNLNWAVEVSSYADLTKASKGLLNRVSGAVSYLDVVASAATAWEAQVNLIPEELHIQKSVEAQGHEVFFAAVSIILIMLFVGAGLGVQVYFKHSFLSRIKNNYKEAHDQVDGLKSAQQQIQIVKNFMANRMASLDLLSELYKYIPNSVYLSSVVLDSSGAINIQGVSDTGSTVYNFGSELEKSDIFHSAEIKSTTSKKDRGKDATAFEIAIKLESMTGDEPEAAVEKK